MYIGDDEESDSTQGDTDRIDRAVTSITVQSNDVGESSSLSQGACVCVCV